MCVVRELRRFEQSTHIARAADDATIELIAGSFEVSVDREGVVDELIHLSAEDHGTIIVHGSGFNYPHGEVTDLAGTLEGQLLDGNPFRWNFVRTTDARILLIPEPTGLAIAYLALPVLARKIRRPRMRITR